jgi:hypothetical protein
VKKLTVTRRDPATVCCDVESIKHREDSVSKDIVEYLHKIAERIAPLRAALLNHPLYREIDRLEALQCFMQHHVFAVWDFMSLLKTLQRRLCCVDVPWFPAADPQACRFLNEIVLAEESDTDGRGGFVSHFELYRRAMRQCGADTSAADRFLAALQRGMPLSAALNTPGIPSAAHRFVKQTFQVLEQGKLCAVAAAFTFGREDLLPDVFQRIVDVLNKESGGKLDVFQYYLKRHIGLDADEHGPMATRLLQSLCGSDESLWEQAEQAAVDCLAARQALWDGIYASIRRP